MQILPAVRLALLAAGLAFCGIAQAFVGSIAVGLTQLERDAARIDTAFSADAKVESREMNATVRVYYRPGMVRDEMTVDGHEIVIIRRLDLAKLWMLPGQGMYMEIDPERGSDQAPVYHLVSREVIGPDEVNGIAATRYRTIYDTAEGRFTGDTWFTDDHIAIKAVLVHETRGERQRFSYEFTRLERGAQATALFEIPAGHRRLGLGGGFPAGSFMSSPDTGGAMADTGSNGSGPDTGGGDEDGFVDDLAREAQQSAQDTAKQETKRGVTDAVKQGFGKLFGR